MQVYDVALAYPSLEACVEQADSKPVNEPGDATDGRRRQLSGERLVRSVVTGCLQQGNRLEERGFIACELHCAATAQIERSYRNRLERAHHLIGSPDALGTQSCSVQDRLPALLHTPTVTPGAKPRANGGEFEQHIVERFVRWSMTGRWVYRDSRDV